jgi:hypothetical protein
MRITEAQVRQIVRRKLGSLTEATLAQINDTFSSHSQEKGHPIQTHLAMGRRILYPTSSGPNTGIYSGVDAVATMDARFDKLGIMSRTFHAGFVDLYKNGKNSRLAPGIVQAIQTGTTPVAQMYNILYVVGYGGATNGISATGGAALSAILTDEARASIAPSPGGRAGTDRRTSNMMAVQGFSAEKVAGLKVTKQILGALSEYQPDQQMDAAEFVATMQYFARADVDAIVSKPKTGGGEGTTPAPAPKPTPKPAPRAARPDPTWEKYSSRSEDHRALADNWVTYAAVVSELGDAKVLPRGMRLEDLSPSFDSFKKWWTSTNASGGFKRGGDPAECNALIDKVIADTKLALRDVRRGGMSTDAVRTAAAGLKRAPVGAPGAPRGVTAPGEAGRGQGPEVATFDFPKIGR